SCNNSCQQHSQCASHCVCLLNKCRTVN
uniref:Conotoxin n=2 Tax=Conus amadis TaxID=198732 RepID=CP9_CONAA|nr:RecName: Full=Conotoxin [Conus amadis]